METREPKVEAEELLNAVLPFAQQMLEKYGEFIPYGGAMKPNGEIVSVAGYDGDEYPPSQEIIELLKDAFRDAGRNGTYRATAIVFDVRVIPPDCEEKTDAVAVALDHIENYSVVVLFPYQLVNGTVQFAQVSAEPGNNDIFVH